MRSNFGIKNKKGFGLVECVVALVLFSIVTGSVLTAFTASRKQVKRQNDQYKIDLMANNILAAYEGSNTMGSFVSRLKSLDKSFESLGTGAAGSRSDKFTTTIGTEGVGQYSFDVNNIPIRIKLNEIVVKDGAATVKTEKGDVVFDGEYSDNKLTGDWVNGIYTETEKREPSEMILTGTVHTVEYVLIIFKNDVYYDYTMVVDESNVTITINGMEDPVSKPACDFDKYLLNNKYYLKTAGEMQTETKGTFIKTTYYHYRFQVYDALDNSAVKVGGKNLYYDVSIPKDSQTNVGAKISNVVSGSSVDSTYFDLSKCTVKSATGSSCPSYGASGWSELKNSNGSKFSGKWYFTPWLMCSDEDTVLEPQCSKYTAGSNYHKYTPKSADENLYYALHSAKNSEMLLFNSDNELIFKYDKDAQGALKNLVNNCEFGIDGRRNTQAIYEDKVYDKWYQKGAVPLWDVTEVRFTDGGTTGTSRIEFYGKAAESHTEASKYISFTYTKDNYESFKSDRQSVIDYSGGYADNYDYSKTYASTTSLKKITDKTALKQYEALDKIKDKLVKSKYEMSLLYYTRTGPTTKKSGKTTTYVYTYPYYTYTVKMDKVPSLASFQEKSRTLTVTKSGETESCTETVNGSATLAISYDTANQTVSSVNHTTGTGVPTSSTTNSRTQPSAPREVSGGTYIEGGLTKTHEVTTGWGKNAKKETVIDWDYTSTSWVIDNVIKTKTPANSTETVNDVTGTLTSTGLPADLATAWRLVSEPTEAAIHTVAPLSSFIKNESSYDVVVGDNLVFTAHPTDFVITAGEFSSTIADCEYDVIGGESADITAETNYIVWSTGDRALVSVVTYSNYTKDFDVDGVAQSREPKITIWSMPKSEADKLAEIKDIVGNSYYDQYLYRSYRKG